MVYCAKEEVRKLACLTDLELDDRQLEQIILNGERQVNLETAEHPQCSRLSGALLNGCLETAMFRGLAGVYTT